MQASAPAAAVAAASEHIDHVHYLEAPVTVEDVRSLVTACTDALSSITVAAGLPLAVYVSCNPTMRPHSAGNREACGSGGAIEAVLAAMSAYGAVDVDVAMNGCRALTMLSFANPVNADHIVLLAGGVDVICSVMAAITGIPWSPRGQDVLSTAITALLSLARYGSPEALAAMRADRTVELIKTVKWSHYRNDITMKHDIEDVLERLTG